MKIAVQNLENKKVGDITLNKDVFGVEVRADILQRMVNYQLAKRRSGTSAVKLIGDVQGTTKKPWAQKGTGRARASSLRQPQARGGAIIFGPQPRSYKHSLTKKMRKLALKTILSDKLAEKKLIIIDDAKAKTPKTKEMAKVISGLKLDSAVFIGGEELDKNFVLAVRNIPKIEVFPVQGANVYDIMRRDVLVLTKDAVAKLEERLA